MTMTKMHMRLFQRLPATTTRGFHASRSGAFLFRTPDDVASEGHTLQTEKGAIESRRYLVRSDGCGFSMHHEILRKSPTPVRLEFRNHVYAVFVTKGNGRLQLLDAHNKHVDRHDHVLEQGSFFALHASEPVAITVESDELHVVSVMNPPLVGPEQKNEATGVFPMIDDDGIEREDFDHALIRRICEPPESLKAGSSPMKNDPLF